MLYLNVAEKPSVARGVASAFAALAGARAAPVASATQFHPVVRVDGVPLPAGASSMLVTSVRGHLTEIDFDDDFQNWQRVPPDALFAAPILTRIPKDCKALERNLTNLSRQASGIILWLDCDREGENICFEVLGVCLKANRRLRVHRARFSAVTRNDVQNALQTLDEPNERHSQAVEVRKELDLRIGAAITRLLTLHIKHKFELNTKVLSYGPCQLPTLGFIVTRWLRIQRFVCESFYTLELQAANDDADDDEARWVKFKMKGDPIYDQVLAMMTYQKCLDALPTARIVDTSQVDSKVYTPTPLNTLVLMKRCSEIFRIPAHEVMKVAESLYQKGFISYPRTETNSFKPDTEPYLRELVEQQRQQADGALADYLQNHFAFRFPRKGRSDDQAHPPIHPVKAAGSQHSFGSALERSVYDFVVTHFIASCSLDAIKSTQTTRVCISDEQFEATHSFIKEANFLRLYGRYSTEEVDESGRFAADALHVKRFLLRENQTSPPALLTESELISLMDQHSIGTDATMHEHIKTIETRGYIARTNQHLAPTPLGVALFMSLTRICPELTSPQLRASTEAALGRVAAGDLAPADCLRTAVHEYARQFATLRACLADIEACFRQWLIV